MIFIKCGVLVLSALFLLFLILRVKKLWDAKEEADTNRFMDISERKSSVNRFRERRGQLIQQVRHLSDQLSQYYQQMRDSILKQKTLSQDLEKKGRELAALERKIERVQRRTPALRNQNTDDNTPPVNSAAHRLQQNEIGLMASRMSVEDELMHLRQQSAETEEEIKTTRQNITTMQQAIKAACDELGKPERMIRRILRIDQRAIDKLEKMDQKTHRILRSEGIMESAEAMIRGQIY